MTRFLALTLLAGALVTPVVQAQEAEAVEASASADDDLVRLPGSGEVKSQRAREKLKADKLKAGGGLLASFDSDEDGRISKDELSAGIEAAFAAADSDGDGQLSAFEQQDWAASLPTHDDTLANPVRFDPNLDRRVSFAEFSAVITNLWSDYREEGDSVLRVASLKAPEEKKDRFPNLLDGELGTRVGSTDF